MPITFPESIRSIKQAPFHSIDRSFMEVAFKVHNNFGKLLDEKIYQNLMLSHLSTSGHVCEAEATISVDESEALVVTGLTKESGVASYKKHLRRVLNNTELEAISWVNFNRCNITQLTLFR